MPVWELSIKDTGYNIANSLRFDEVEYYLYDSTDDGTEILDIKFMV